MSYFDSIFSFAQVTQVEEGINRVEYINACKDLVKIFDYLSPTAFAPVKKDLLGNIATLENLVEQRLDQFIQKGEIEKSGTATCALLWLNRGLNFTCQSLQLAQDNPNKELSECFSTAYGQTLSKYHSFLVKPIFSLAMKAIPYRKNFYENLSAGKSEADILPKQKEWLAALSKIVEKTHTIIGQQ
eukprot:NODE_113_length_18482_cov_1.630746.p13 type:complete len:186 gc:universal NODE_113_length_18482_cov_1.630746:13461-12904(-)